ncbi:MAG: HAD family hydrolase [Lachnospiraceae bacterium]|nr:HAD family hydrolase [Lachnospiraceae bacterium]
MSIKMILFDLDGTLLPMDQEVFVKTYFGLLAKKLAPYGYEPDKLIQAVWAGTGAMVKNDGKESNEERFWQTFAQIYGVDAKKDIAVFDDFYRNEFAGVKDVCGYHPKAAETVRALKEKGFRVALATNPIFPQIATAQRIRWTGLTPEDFELFTTYENSHFCKPNLSYYEEVLERLGVTPQECLMVGNDVSEDMIAEKLGMKVFLLTDCLINKEDKDISVYPSGSFEQLLECLL